ncbi:MAG: hypothetical protein AAF639_46530 [Chloroflexota bacterium]
MGAIFGLGTAMQGNGLQWPLAQAVLLPELRASGRAAINMAAGIASAIVLTVSGTLADMVGIPQMLLYIVPLPAFLSIIAWIPMYYSYANDRQQLHETLTQRRVELLEN